ncbi:MAG TPA: isochorismatase family protein [Rhizomicrobium sp.]
MTTLPNRPHTALLIVDVQTGVVAGNFERDAVVANIAQLVEKARRARAAVIWVRHNSSEFVEGTKAWAIVAELSPGKAEPIIDKRYGDAFEATDLETVLADRGIGRLIVAGAQSDGCIRSTLHGALVRGYDTILVSDAHTTEDMTQWGAPPPGHVVAHTNLYWTYQTAPGREAGTVTTADAVFA